MPRQLLSHLRIARAQLKPLSTSCYAPLERETLRSLLTATITNLRQIYRKSLSSVQKYKLLQNLALLEQQAAHLGDTSTDSHGCAAWSAINTALQVAIADVLSPPAADPTT